MMVERKRNRLIRPAPPRMGFRKLNPSYALRQAILPNLKLDANTLWLYKTRPGQQDAERRIRSNVTSHCFDWKTWALKANERFSWRSIPMAIKFGRPLEATVRFAPAEAKIGGIESAPVQLDLTAR